MNSLHPFIIFWDAHPILKLLLPFIIGIILADRNDGGSNQALQLVAILGGISLIATCICLKLKEWRFRHFFGISAMLLFLSMGYITCSLQWKSAPISFPTQSLIYEGVLTDATVIKSQSRQCPIQLTSRWEGDSHIPINGKIWLYLPKDTLTQDLHPGDRIYFKGIIKKSDENPFKKGHFNYSRYLKHHSINGTCYTSQWTKLDSAPHFSFTAYATHVREVLLNYYRSMGFEGENFALLSALTLGYKAELNQNLKERFSDLGVGHILALSGLHIGIICSVIIFFYTFFLPGERFRTLRYILAIPFIWIFVWIIGMPISAVRAAWMFTLFCIGNLVTRVGYPLNTLAITAFGMLLYNPFTLFDIGFQLSFTAVASIFLLLNPLKNIFPPTKHTVLDYLWNITSISLAAQIGLFPLLIYHFEQFAPYALLTNLWIIPLTWIIIAIAMLFLLTACFTPGWIQQGIAYCLDWLVEFMNQGLELNNHLPGISIKQISIDGMTFSLLYAIIFFGCYAWIQHWLRGWTITFSLIAIVLFWLNLH